MNDNLPPYVRGQQFTIQCGRITLHCTFDEWHKLDCGYRAFVVFADGSRSSVGISDLIPVVKDGAK